MGALSNLVSLGIGVYSGIYIAQNYEVAKVDEPAIILDKLKHFIEDIMKPKT